MNQFKNKKILIVGIGKIGFKLIDFFNKFNCSIKVTDLKPIFDLNKQIKRLKKMPTIVGVTFGEHKDEDFLEADIIVYDSIVNPNLPQLELARKSGKMVYSEFALANMLCKKPLIAVCGSFGRTVVAHMIGFALKLDGRNVFVGGTKNSAFIEYASLPNKDSIEYVVVEVSSLQMRKLKNFNPKLIVFTTLSENFPEKHFQSIREFIDTKFSVLKTLGPKNTLVVNFDKLSANSHFTNLNCKTLWYSRKSFIEQEVIDQVRGTHFHKRRIYIDIDQHSEFIVSKMRIIGQNNRENILAALTACKALNVSDEALQNCIEKFPGIPHRLEFLMEKNGVLFYNDSKTESMNDLVENVKLFKAPMILVAGGKDVEDLDYSAFTEDIEQYVRILVLVGECKEKMNRAFGKRVQTYIVGSFEESVLLAYQKSRTGDVILLSPGNPATDFFRDYEERGGYYKKLVYQL